MYSLYSYHGTVCFRPEKDESMKTAFCWSNTEIWGKWIPFSPFSKSI